MGHDILIVDDERDICTLIAGILEDEGNTARRAHNSTEAIDAVRQRRPSLVILDVWLQGSELDGLQLLDIIRREEPPVPVVMISGHGTIDTAVSAIKTGAYDFIEKPFKADRLLLVVLTGMGNDGLRGAHEVRKRGGRILAEAEQTCTVYGMPRAIVEAKLADDVLPLDQMAQAISTEMRR